MSSQAFGAKSSEGAFLFHLSRGGGPERAGRALTWYLPLLLHQTAAPGAPGAHTGVTQVRVHHAGCPRSLDPLP